MLHKSNSNFSAPRTRTESTVRLHFKEFFESGLATPQAASFLLWHGRSVWCPVISAVNSLIKVIPSNQLTTANTLIIPTRIGSSVRFMLFYVFSYLRFSREMLSNAGKKAIRKMKAPLEGRWATGCFYENNISRGFSGCHVNNTQLCDSNKIKQIRYLYERNLKIIERREFVLR